jgi:outer membrane lipoprotein-sorting protein
MKRFWLAAVVALSLLPFAAVAQDKKQDPPKPAAPLRKADKTVDEVMTKFVEATGGKEAYEKIKSSVSKGKLEMKPQGMEGDFEIITKAPGMMFMRQSFQGAFEVTLGFDGKKGWAKDPLSGLRDLEGSELTEMKRQAVFASEPQKWNEVYSKAEMLGIKKLDDKTEAYVIRMTPKEGNAITQYFDAKTFLLVRFEGKQQSPQGEMEVEAEISDYKAVDGVKVPYITKMKIAGIAEIVLTIKEIKNNVEVDAKKFAKPKE